MQKSLRRTSVSEVEERLLPADIFVHKPSRRLLSSRCSDAMARIPFVLRVSLLWMAPRFSRPVMLEMGRVSLANFLGRVEHLISHWYVIR